MLYHLVDLNEAMMTPLRMAAGATQIALQNPLSLASYTRTGRAMAAGAELFERTTRRYPKPAFGLDITTGPDGSSIPVEEQVVLARPFCRLLRFTKPTVEAPGPKVLLVAPLSGHWATLLRGTVEALLPHHDVYITDWADASQVPLAAGYFGFDDYVQHVLMFLRHLAPGGGLPSDVHVMAVCQPTVPVLAAVGLLAQAEDPAQPLSMTLMGGPVDTRAAPTQVTQLAETRPITWFDRTVIHRVPNWRPGALRRVYPGFLQLTGFMTMNLERHIGSHMDLFRHLVEGDGDSAEAHRTFYDEYLSVLDLTAEFFLQTVYRVFQKQQLPRGEMVVNGTQVDLSQIRSTALMTVEGEKDDISAPGQTIAAHGLCPGVPRDLHQDYLCEGVGHYGIFNGRRWRNEIRPRITAFMAEQEARRADALRPTPVRRPRRAAA